MSRRKRRRPSGMGCVYQRGPGNFWIKWREGGQIRFAHGYETRELAQKVLSKIVAEIGAGRAGLPQDPNDVPMLESLADDWLTRRELTHRAWSDDKNRWNRHLKKFFGTCRPSEVNAAGIRRFIEAKLAEKLNPATVGHCVRMLSTFFTDLVERNLVERNPVRSVTRATRALYKPTTDPRSTPFLEKLEDIRRIFQSLPEPINIAFALGAFGGLRTGEVLGLEWRDIDLNARRVTVRRQLNEGELTRLKDDESRIVPIQDALLSILTAYKLKSGGDGLLFRAGWHGLRGGTAKTKPTFMRPHTLHRYLRDALQKCTLTPLTWYQATRHTFASQWVINGGSMEKLSVILGHSSVVVTARYAHLRVDHFREADFQMLTVNLSQQGSVAELPTVPPAEAAAGTVGYAVVTQGSKKASKKAAKATTPPLKDSPTRL
jgi:integrase